MSDNQNLPTARLLHVAPQHWLAVGRFKQLWATTYIFERLTQNRLLGIVGHFSKAGYLFELAKRLAPNVDVDSAPLRDLGYSPLLGKKELAAMIESVLCEQYSVLDCCRAVLCGVFPNHKGIEGSTRSTSPPTHKGKLYDRLSASIREAIANTRDWYLKLLRRRDELTHTNIRSCHRDDKNGYARGKGERLRYE
jgi:hypothetical protein